MVSVGLGAVPRHVLPCHNNALPVTDLARPWRASPVSGTHFYSSLLGSRVQYILSLRGWEWGTILIQPIESNFAKQSIYVEREAQARDEIELV